MGFNLRRLKSDMQPQWNDFVEKSNEGTIFHRLNFLSYDGKRFATNDHSLCVFKGDALYGVMPMGIFELDGRHIAKSPYCASYGGPVFLKPQNYHDSHEMIEGLLEYIDSLQVCELSITLPISVCYRHYSDTFRLVLMERGFRCSNREISSVVRLHGKESASQIMTSRARNMAQKARKLGVETVVRAPMKDFWQVMEKTFKKHNDNPTHSFKEFSWLHENLPDLIYANVAYLKGKPMAGIGHFVINRFVNSSFYLCQDPRHQQTQALSLLVCETLEDCLSSGFHWFDFGTSSINMKGRGNIFRFKESFGATGVFRETYLWHNPKMEQILAS
jgi:hypothetical protein